ACDGGGYVGRTGIFELLEIGDSIREGIAAGASSSALAQLARSAGYEAMRSAGIAKVAAGLTTLDELARVVS
ncbi:MAG: hypothetical protein JOY59_12415, partial [Candidatus Eremiobacteraeota bacterium]|nr:hypothetical protein [Candidatus Eremiobacteraeota bacterium]